MYPHWMPDSQRVVFARSTPKPNVFDSDGSRLYVVDIKTGNVSPLFSQHAAHCSHAFPAVSPDGQRIAYVVTHCPGWDLHHNGTRLVVSNIDGTNARLASPGGPTEVDLQNDGRITPISQKAPTWSPDGKFVAHWEGVEMIWLSQFNKSATPDPKRDELITQTFHVWVAAIDGGSRQVAGKGDDPSWSADGRLTRSYPDPQHSPPGIVIMIQSSGGGWEELPIVPPGTMDCGRFDWARTSFRVL